MACKEFTAFEIASGSHEPLSLQQSFLQFRTRKQDYARASMDRKKQQQSAAKQAGPERVAELRRRFLEQAKTYIGVPYAQKYHEPDTEEYRSPLFLDCCGLVRQVLRDLKEELGVIVGPWNQAYMFDTLPIALEGPKQMEPGDLVFISGTYNNPKAKPQRHDMVHVEIWLGEGEKTVGARWQRGRVQIHDSYEFEPKSYHNASYYFRSITTWLRGECKSHCQEHAWELRKFDPSKYSIFAIKDESCDPQQETEQSAKQSVDGGEGGHSTVEEQEEVGEQLPVEGQSGVRGELTVEGLSGVRGELSVEGLSGVRETASEREKERGNVCLPKPAQSVPKSARTFLTVGANAATLVRQVLSAKGWTSVADQASTAFTLKWTERKQHIDFAAFKEGEQMVNHFPNIRLLTNKIGLLESLRGYAHSHKQHILVNSFLPPTHRMDVPKEREQFFSNYQAGELWICKPTGANRGKGIFLVRELHQLTEKLEADQRNCKMTSRPIARIVQKYITPLLLDGRKFDIRVYMLVIAAQPYIVLYRDGYVRLCCEPYSASSQDLTVHLTNQTQQKKHPLYSERKEDTVWDFSRLQVALTEQHGLPSDWVTSTLTKQMKSIMTVCFNSVQRKLQRMTGCFELLGFDFMLDSSMHLWLIEVNINPAMHTNCSILETVAPSTITETLDLVIEVFDKCRRFKPLLPLVSLRDFTTLITK